MIRTDKGYMEIKGTMLDLLTDLSVITHRLKETFSKDIEEEEVDDILRQAFETGLKSSEEVRQGIKEKLEEADVETLVKVLKEVLKHE